MTEFKIGITGHRPQKFSNQVVAKQKCYDTTQLYAQKYNEVVFNLGGCIGADSWVAECCMLHKISFNLFLPFPSEVQGKYWSDQERVFLDKQISNARSVDIVQSTFSKAAYHIRDRNIVDNSDMVICFLEDLKSGTYATAKYALKQNKIVFNGLTDMFLSK